MAYDLEIGAMTIFGEASGEGDDGQLAVAFVLLNRLNSKRWGDTLASVCLYAEQFSCWNALMTINGKTINNPDRMRIAAATDAQVQKCASALLLAEHGDMPDPTNGSMFYERIGSGASWAVGKTPCAVIGNHAFYNDVV